MSNRLDDTAGQAALSATFARLRAAAAAEPFPDLATRRTQAASR
ncbi:hypothetical protein [Crenobacter cavernae]|nr:hypothetical protein [Crenobacter cavernae]